MEGVRVVQTNAEDPEIQLAAARAQASHAAGSGGTDRGTSGDGPPRGRGLNKLPEPPGPAGSSNLIAPLPGTRHGRRTIRTTGDAGVPKSVPELGQITILRQPTPTRFPIRTGLKSSISGPFCDSRQPFKTAAFDRSATPPLVCKYTLGKHLRIVGTIQRMQIFDDGGLKNRRLSANAHERKTFVDSRHPDPNNRTGTLLGTPPGAGHGSPIAWASSVHNTIPDARRDVRAFGVRSMEDCR